MNKKANIFLSRLFLLAGLVLLLYGGVSWWRQIALEHVVGGERIVLAVTKVPTERAQAPVAAVTLEAVTDTEDASDTDDEPSEARPVATPTPVSQPFPPASAPPTRILAPAIGLEAPVVEMGWEVKANENGEEYSEWLVPAFAAGWHKNSALPGHTGNTVLSAHHNIEGEVFRYIVDLEPGDRVDLEADGRMYRYTVEEKYIVAEKNQPLAIRIENAQYIQPTNDDRLTLVTCWPYETNTHRVVVVARPIAVPDVEPILTQ